MSKTALITGSSKGLGKNLALVFSKNKYDIILHGRNKGNLKEIKKKILENNVNCYVVEGDINLDETIERLSEMAKEKDICVLINNAAIGPVKPFDNLKLSELEQVIKTNLIAPIKLTRKIYPLFLKKKAGTIININSFDGLKGGRLKTIYGASKYGLRGFTDSLRFEANDNNIRVIGVYLGGMKTDMYTQRGKDSSKCIDPLEAAQIIFNSYENCQDYEYSSIDDIVINRKKY